MQNSEIVKAFTYARDNKKQVHFMGLVSDGGVHSSLEHLKKLCDVSKEFGIAKLLFTVLWMAGIPIRRADWDS